MPSIDYSSPDVDRGWAFVVLLSGTLTLIMTRGLTYTSAIFYITFLDEFEESSVFTAWAVGSNIFCSLVTCVFLNFLLLMVGPRVTVIVGCTLSTIGLFTCSFATNMTFILLSYGIVTGVGFACSFLATITMISMYFNKYRVIAFAIVNAGTGIGQLLFPPILRAVIEEYEWQGSFIVLAGINLNMLVIAAAYMQPRTFIKIKEDKGIDKIKLVIRQLVRNAKIFRKPCWPLYCMATGIYNLGINAFQTHISNYGRVAGLSTEQQTLLPSIIGIGSLSGSLVIGMITQLPRVPVVAMFSLTFILLGIVSIVVTFADTVIGLFACSFGAGFSFATIALSYEVVIFIIGVQRFSSAYSYALIFSATGALAGGPVAAALNEVDKSYHLSYRTTGFIVLSGVFLLTPSWLTFRNGRIQLKIAKDKRVVKESILS